MYLTISNTYTQQPSCEKKTKKNKIYILNAKKSDKKFK